MSYDPVSFGERLSEEVKRAADFSRLGTLPRRPGEPVSLRELEAALVRETGGTRGTSRGNLSTWLRGRGPEAGEPRRNVVEALARLFSSPGATVRPEYLLYGGPRTEEEAETRTRTPFTEVLYARIPVLERLPLSFALALLDHAFMRANLDRQGTEPTRSETEDMEETLTHVEETWCEIAQPLEGCSLNYDAFNYLNAALHARSLALRLTPKKEH